MAKLIVTIEYSPGDAYTVCKNIDEPFYCEQISPVDVCEEPIGALFGGVMSAEFITIVKKRKGFAKTLAFEITEMITESLGKKDTFNGCPIETERDKRVMRNLSSW